MLASRSRRLFAAAALCLLAPLAAHASVPSPEEFLGRPVGEDRHLFTWDRMVAYYEEVGRTSDRVDVVELGTSTEGRPFLLVKVADAGALRSTDAVRAQNRALYDARATTEAEARALAANGRATVAFSLGVHSVEVGSSQAGLRIVHRLATRDDAVTRRIRENLMILIVPSMNPDGLDLVNEWYMETVGTEAEGTRPLELYHPYAGHDNNRDGFFNNLVETSMWSQVLYHDWLPQMIVDEHQMGSGGPRLFLPPFDDPLSPSVHPLVYSQLAAAGQQVVSDLTAEGWTGIATQTIFTAEWPGSVRSTGFWHNMLGILSEVASARLATPLYFPPGSVQAWGRGLPEYERRTNFLEPWPGGWWRLDDIVSLKVDLTWGFLRWAADRREDLLFNFWRMNRDAIAAGRNEAPYAFVVPRDQVDGGSDDRMMEILHSGGVELHRADSDLRFGDHLVDAGAWVIRTDQPFRPFVLEMLGDTDYPMIEQSDGSVIRPYDVTAWRLSELLGVRVLEVHDRDALDALDLSPVDPGRADRVEPLRGDLVVPATDLASHALVHAALGAGKTVERFEHDGRLHYLVEDVDRSLDDVARDVEPVDVPVAADPEPVTAPRLALFAPWGGNKDEGWTRLVLDRHRVEYRRIRPGEPDLRGADDGRRLRRTTDVVLLPSVRSRELENGRQSAGEGRVADALWPERHRRGLGGTDAGMALRAFVEAGGTLIALNHSTPWVVEKLGLPVRVELDGMDRDDFYAPGTLVRGELDTAHPLAAGMPATTSLYFANGYAYRPQAWPRPTAVVAHYAADDVRVAGFLTGAEHLAGRPALLEVPVGEGRVVLFGFSPQRRAQTDGTFKLLLNALLR